MYFKDSAGGLHVIQDVRFQPNGGRGTYRGTFSVNHVRGRGWLVLPNRAPIAISVEKVEPTDTEGLNLYYFIES